MKKQTKKISKIKQARQVKQAKHANLKNPAKPSKKSLRRPKRPIHSAPKLLRAVKKTTGRPLEEGTSKDMKFRVLKPEGIYRKFSLKGAKKHDSLFDAVVSSIQKK